MEAGDFAGVQSGDVTELMAMNRTSRRRTTHSRVFSAKVGDVGWSDGAR